MDYMGETFKNHKKSDMKSNGSIVWIKELFCVNYCVRNVKNTIPCRENRTILLSLGLFPINFNSL